MIKSRLPHNEYIIVMDFYSQNDNGAIVIKQKLQRLEED